MSAFLNIGTSSLPGPSGGVTISIKYKAAAKIDKKEVDGKNDATVTNKGRKARDINVTLEWLYSPRDPTVVGGKVNLEVCAFLAGISPSVVPGASFDFAEQDSTVQFAMNVKSVMIEDIDIEDYDPSRGTRKATIHAVSWGKGSASANVTDTPNKSVSVDAPKVVFDSATGHPKDGTGPGPLAPKFGVGP